MYKINLIITAQAVGLFLFCYFLLSFVYVDKKEKKVVNRSVYRKYSFRTAIYLFAAAVGVTILINAISASKITTAIAFFSAVSLIPYVYESNQKRIAMEMVFQDVILYCSSMGMLLKQNRNVYTSLQRVKEDLRTSLAEDVQVLIEVMDEGGREDTMKAMKQIEKNYPYTCIVNLNLIMLHMKYENANLDPVLFDTFQDDVADLERDVKKNRLKRTALRIQYIGISAGCLGLYWWFMQQLIPSYPEGFSSSTYQIFNLLFISGTFITLFAVDRYFNANITKE